MKTSINSTNVCGVNKGFIALAGHISSTTHEWMCAKNSDIFKSDVI